MYTTLSYFVKFGGYVVQLAVQFVVHRGDHFVKLLYTSSLSNGTTLRQYFQIFGKTETAFLHLPTVMSPTCLHLPYLGLYTRILVVDTPPSVWPPREYSWIFVLTSINFFCFLLIYLDFRVSNDVYRAISKQTQKHKIQSVLPYNSYVECCSPLNTCVSAQCRRVRSPGLSPGAAFSPPRPSGP